MPVQGRTLALPTWQTFVLARTEAERASESATNGGDGTDGSRREATLASELDWPA
jgi:hypothetical protein